MTWILVQHDARVSRWQSSETCGQVRYGGRQGDFNQALTKASPVKEVA